MFDRNLFKIAGMRNLLVGLFVFALVQAGLIIAMSNGLSSSIVTFWEGSALESALTPILCFGASFLLLQLVRFAQDSLLERFSRNAAHALQRDVLESTFGDSSRAAYKWGTARMASVATDGIEEVQAYLRIIPPKMVGMVAISVPLLICVFILDWPSGIILAIMFPVIIFFMVLLGKQARARSERQYASYTRLTNRFMDTLRGMRTIKALGAVEHEALDLQDHSEKLRLATMRTLSVATLSSAVLDFCATFGVAAVAMMLAFRLMDGSVGLWTALMALIISPEYFNPIRAFASDYHASLDGKNALSSVLEILEDQDEPKAETRQISESVATDTPITIGFNDVSFAYSEGTRGVHNVSFSFTGPKKVGIVGPSGSGKSTLANLLAGFCSPTSGSVSVNGEELDLASPPWKALVRYIPQEPYLFRDTLARNIAFYCPDANEEEILGAAQAVGLGPLVDSLPEGLDTLVGDGARGLSGGEAHRVALARVLLDKSARVLVFDEPTAHLDIETELDLREPMLQAMKGKLVFFATHRLHWTDDMDTVLRLDNGRVIDKGAEDER